MSNPSAQPRILFVTPEVTFIPNSSEHMIRYMVTDSGGVADYLADLIVALYDLGVDVHVVQPDYRQIFSNTSREQQRKKAKKIPAGRIHLTEDRAFFYSNYPDSNYKWENIKISLAFQREVINQILPWVQPDLIHCHDWMTGLTPPMAKKMDIPCLFTIHNSHSAKSYLSYIEDTGLDAAAFWQHLFYDRYPANYEETRDANPFDFLLSGVFSADFVSSASLSLLIDMAEDQSVFFKASLSQVLAQKWQAGCISTFNHASDAQQYIDLYERILQRPITHIKSKNYKLHGYSTPQPRRSNRVN